MILSFFLNCRILIQEIRSWYWLFFQPYLFLCITMVSANAIQIKGQPCALIKVLWSGFMLVKQENLNKFLWDLWQMSLTFHVNIFESFPPDEKLSIPEFCSLKELYKSCCSNLILPIRKLRTKDSGLSARASTSMQFS